MFLDRQGLSENILQDQVNLGFAVYKPGSPDMETARLIDAYDPAWEIVFQYMRQDGDVRAVRVRTAPGNRHPWRKKIPGAPSECRNLYDVSQSLAWLAKRLAGT